MAIAHQQEYHAQRGWLQAAGLSPDFMGDMNREVGTAGGSVGRGKLPLWEAVREQTASSEPRISLGIDHFTAVSKNA